MADRGLTSGMNSAVAAGTIRPAIFYEGTFNGAPLRLWTGLGSYTSANAELGVGKVFAGNGLTVAIAPLPETTELQANGFSVTLSGLPSAQLAMALNDARVSRYVPGKIWLALFDAAGALIRDPYQLQLGRFSSAPVSDSGDKATIQLIYESVLADLQRTDEFRYTTQSQALDYPGDLGFSMVESLQDISFNLWKR